jgi:hypothetical protein
MMTARRTFSATISLLLSALASPLAIAAAPANAQSIINEWATMKPPAACFGSNLRNTGVARRGTLQGNLP